MCVRFADSDDYIKALGGFFRLNHSFKKITENYLFYEKAEKIEYIYDKLNSETEDIKMEESKERYSKLERAYRILEYLKKNSDSEHTITQASLRKVPDLEKYLGDKETYNDTIVKIAMAMNLEEYGAKPEGEWKIIFKDFKKIYGESSLDENEENSDDEQTKMRIRGLYYNHTFSYEEINSLIEGVLFSKTLDSKTANELVEKIENNLTTNFYPKGAKRICKVQEPVLADREILRKNLLTIQQAIDNSVQVSFTFNGYNRDKQLVANHNKKDVVSPYYIVASSGRYYLLACKELVYDKKTVRNMSIWRIDLMSEIEIPNRDDKRNIKGIPSINKREVENLPQSWSEDFQLSHLNMSFDNPVKVKLKIKSPKDKDNRLKPLRADYTFMYDWFGDTFRYIRTEETAPFDDIVEVRCSPFAMANWALQYSDRVEVLEPESVRNMVIEKVKNLMNKYIKE